MAPHTGDEEAQKQSLENDARDDEKLDEEFEVREHPRTENKREHADDENRRRIGDEVEHQRKRGGSRVHAVLHHVIRGSGLPPDAEGVIAE